jgi:hypothetical protein
MKIEPFFPLATLLTPTLIYAYDLQTYFALLQFFVGQTGTCIVKEDYYVIENYRR